MNKEVSSEEEKTHYKEVVFAVESGNNKAKTELAWYKLSGCGGAEVDVDDAVVLLEERRKDRDVEAIWMLGLCYEYGIGCDQDLEEAERLYKESCNGGSIIGMFLVENGEDDERGSVIMKVEESL